MNASRMENQAKMKEKYLHYADSLDIDRHLYEKGKIDENYLESARMKMALLSQMKK